MERAGAERAVILVKLKHECGEGNSSGRRVGKAVKRR